jgi:hypothetical protein
MRNRFGVLVRWNDRWYGEHNEVLELPTLQEAERVAAAVRKLGAVSVSVHTLAAARKLLANLRRRPTEETGDD